MDIKKFFDSLGAEEINRINKLQLEESKREYTRFKNAYDKGSCYLCGQSLEFVDENDSCFHWLLMPPGIKKKHIEKFFKEHISYIEISTYLRWAANTEKPLKNINDLKEEMNPAKLFESTIVFKDIEYSFSFTLTDLEGHQTSNHSNFPHYHISIVIAERPFVNFSDFHIRFSEHDIFALKAMAELPNRVRIAYPFGEGMQDALSEENIETIFHNLTATDDFENAPFRVQTMIAAKEGQSIAGSDIVKAIEESKRTGEPIGRILGRLSSVENAAVVITPGDGVPEIQKRTSRKKK